MGLFWGGGGHYADLSTHMIVDTCVDQSILILF